MRIIKFRGFCVNNKCHIGLLAISRGLIGQPDSGHYISNGTGMPWAYNVRPETVCQFTELTDKNGEEIFEGDIVTCKIYGMYEIWKIIWDLEELNILKNISEGNKTLKIIGNIYENSELLKKKNFKLKDA